MKHWNVENGLPVRCLTTTDGYYLVDAPQRNAYGILRRGTCEYVYTIMSVETYNAARDAGYIY